MSEQMSFAELSTPAETEPLGSTIEQLRPPSTDDSHHQDNGLVFETSSKQHAATSEKEKVQETRTPRPPNSWILYRSAKFQEIKDRPSNKGKSQAAISRLVSVMWKEESEGNRLAYEKMAEERKRLHQQTYPGYRYRPRRGRKSSSPNKGLSSSATSNVVNNSTQVISGLNDQSIPPLSPPLQIQDSNNASAGISSSTAGVSPISSTTDTVGMEPSTEESQINMVFQDSFDYIKSNILSPNTYPIDSELTNDSGFSTEEQAINESKASIPIHNVSAQRRRAATWFPDSKSLPNFERGISFTNPFDPTSRTSTSPSYLTRHTTDELTNDPKDSQLPSTERTSYSQPSLYQFPEDSLWEPHNTGSLPIESVNEQSNNEMSPGVWQRALATLSPHQVPALEQDIHDNTTVWTQLSGISVNGNDDQVDKSADPNQQFAFSAFSSPCEPQWLVQEDQSFPHSTYLSRYSQASPTFAIHGSTDPTYSSSDTSASHNTVSIFSDGTDASQMCNDIRCDCL